MKISTRAGVVDIQVSFPVPDKVAFKATQDGELLGYEVIDSVEASYRFMNNLPPFADPPPNTESKGGKDEE